MWAGSLRVRSHRGRVSCKLVVGRLGLFDLSSVRQHKIIRKVPIKIWISVFSWKNLIWQILSGTMNDNKLWLSPLDRHVLFSFPPPSLLLLFFCIQAASLVHVNSQAFPKYRTLGEHWRLRDWHALEQGLANFFCKPPPQTQIVNIIGFSGYVVSIN